jgi:hypothetical protein
LAKPIEEEKASEPVEEAAKESAKEAATCCAEGAIASAV